MSRILITGGAGFIGSAVARLAVAEGHQVLVVDKLTYAGNLHSLESIAKSSLYGFLKADICDEERMRAAFDEFQPGVVLHLAAESHVDRSIDDSAEFIRTNVVGTHVLLNVSTDFWRKNTGQAFRFLHVSTDEVFGHLGPTGRFTESSPYDPRSPYSASKAASDHLVRAWNRTYDLPALISNCSNNFGPRQFPEKLIPLIILNALEGKPLPVYGTGENVRDWLYVDDHARALLMLAAQGKVGSTYNVGAECERRNIDVVNSVCDILDELQPDTRLGSRRSLIKFVADRPGHDHRYAIDPSRIASEIGWRPKHSFEDALRLTVSWYLENRSWWERIRSNVYKGERLGAAFH